MYVLQAGVFLAIQKKPPGIWEEARHTGKHPRKVEKYRLGQLPLLIYGIGCQVHVPQKGSQQTAPHWGYCSPQPIPLKINVPTHLPIIPAPNALPQANFSSCQDSGHHTHTFPPEPSCLRQSGHDVKIPGHLGGKYLYLFQNQNKNTNKRNICKIMNPTWLIFPLYQCNDSLQCVIFYWKGAHKGYRAYGKWTM